MSKSAMLRTRRRDVNVKPNRRLDRKSSRGMIYENEELRLKTININAEIERGQSDIKKLRKENEQLRKEIWCLRDEYDKLDRLLKEKQDCTSSSDSDSCTSCSESEDPETTQNLENVQKTTLNSLRNDFDHLSVVTEETSAENSDKNSQNSAAGGLKDPNWEALPPDMSYPLFGTMNTTTQHFHLNGGRSPQKQQPLSGILGGQTRTLPLPTTSNSQCPRHFFAPLKSSKSDDTIGTPENCAPTNCTPYKPWSPRFSPPPVLTTFTCAPGTLTTQTPPKNHIPTILRMSANNLVPLEKSAPDILVQSNPDENSSNSFINGGNLDELLQDIDNLSQDILKISTNQGEGGKTEEPPFKSEISVVLMPKPMPLLGFDKYQTIQSSLESLEAIPPVFVTSKCDTPQIPEPDILANPEVTPTSPQPTPQNPFFYGTFPNDPPKPNMADAPQPNNNNEGNPPKRTRKLSIYFKGTKNKNDGLESPKVDAKDSDNQKSSDSKASYEKKNRKSSSTSPERRHVHIHETTGKKSHKKRQRKLNRRNSTSLEKFHRDRRSFSICTDRSAIGFDEFLTNSERDRSNSLSSCDTIKSRKASHLPQLAVAGKIPWFGCWGNGCL